MSHILELPKLRVVRAVLFGRQSRIMKLRERDPGAVRAVSYSRVLELCRTVFRAAQLGTRPELHESSLVQSCFGVELPGRAAAFPSGSELPGRFRIGFRAAISCSNLEYSENGYTNRNFVLFCFTTTS